MTKEMKIKRKQVYLWIILGAGFLIAALVLTMYNIRQSRKADYSAEKALSSLCAEIDSRSASYAAEDDNAVETAVENLYDECETENTSAEESQLEIDGQYYLGYVTIPSLGVELPVLSEWSYSNLKRSPCRYAGTIADGNLILAAHNYQSHFGRISSLNTGDEIDFTDVNGVTYVYEVVQSELISGSDIESMEKGSDSWDLTLFTCTWSGVNRVTVRAQQVNSYSG